eukprot:Gb_24421 [translate_table: standard]
MEWDLVVQCIVALLAIGSVWALQGFPRKFLDSMLGPGKARIQARRHFVQGAQLLGRSKSSSAQNTSRSLAREAAEEADKAIALDPKDAACYILKGLALERQGQVAEAITSLDAALAPRVVKTLSVSEKSDALLKRAELTLAISSGGGKRRLESALTDLQEAVSLNSKNAKALCLLATCYEKKDMKSEARQAFQDALKAEPAFREAESGNLDGLEFIKDRRVLAGVVVFFTFIGIIICVGSAKNYGSCMEACFLNLWEGCAFNFFDWGAHDARIFNFERENGLAASQMMKDGYWEFIQLDKRGHIAVSLQLISEHSKTCHVSREICRCLPV